MPFVTKSSPPNVVAGAQHKIMGLSKYVRSHSHNLIVIVLATNVVPRVLRIMPKVGIRSLLYSPNSVRSWAPRMIDELLGWAELLPMT